MASEAYGTTRLHTALEVRMTILIFRSRHTASTSDCCTCFGSVPVAFWPSSSPSLPSSLAWRLLRIGMFSFSLAT
jgi:hypothetical protein